MKQIIRIIAIIAAAASCTLCVSCSSQKYNETSSTLGSSETSTVAETSSATSSTQTQTTTAKTKENTSPSKTYLCPFGLSFSSYDIYGRHITASDFSGVKVTMLNFWGTYCGTCISEMPDLGTIGSEYAGKGLKIVGIVIDGTTANAKSKAISIVESTGAGYTHFYADASGISQIEAQYSQSTYIPETVFIDENGNVLGRYVGGKTESEWKDIINNFLAA